MKKFFIIIMMLMCSFGFANNVTLTQDQYNKIIDRLKEDKELLQKNDAKWDKLRKQAPSIEYKVDNVQVVIEKITIPVDKDTPLEYVSNFKVILKNQTEGFFPLRFRLYGGIDLSQGTNGSAVAYQPDAKFAVKIFGLKPLPLSIVQDFGVNAMIGIHGFGFSLSYDLPKPIANTAVHAFYGYTYKMVQIYGFGISVNF
jgi:hypothetical protein